jgi:hypothetical protein
MTDRPATNEPRSQESVVGSSFWHIERADKRVLYIVVIAGLAANLGVVLVVGLRVLEAHLAHRYGLAVVALVLTQLVLAGLGALATRAGSFPASPRSGAGSVILSRVCFCVAALLGVIPLLALVGLAVGVA